MNQAAIPNDLQTVVAEDKAHVWHHLMQHKALETADPRIIVEGKGVRVWDQRGRAHLDAVAGGVWVVNVGYGRTRIADAIRDQVAKMPFFYGALGTVPAARFAARLTAKMPGLSRVYYSNSGSEANEKVFKMVRQIAHRRHGGRKWKILYRERDYHGMTLANLSATGQGQRRAEYGPFVPGFVPVPHCLAYRDPNGAAEGYGPAAADALEAVILREGPDSIGALCLEPITAGGGVITPPEGYWERVQEICTRHEILLHIDEVVCGLGRTGAWFGYQNYGVRPDFVTMAKGVASGYAPIAVTVTTEAVFDAFKADADDPLAHFRDASTFGGCTAGPAAALANLDILEEEDLLANATAMGARLMDNLRALQDRHAVIGDVRGKGLLCGAELVADRESRRPLDERLVKGVLDRCLADSALILGMTNRAIPGFNNTIVFSPPLIATPDEIDEMTEGFHRALSALSA